MHGAVPLVKDAALWLCLDRSWRIWGSGAFEMGLGFRGLGLGIRGLGSIGFIGFIGLI